MKHRAESGGSKAEGKIQKAKKLHQDSIIVLSRNIVWDVIRVFRFLTLSF